MKKTLKRTLSLVLSVCILASIACIATVSASAAAPNALPKLTEEIAAAGIAEENLNTYYFYMPDSWKNEFNDGYDASLPADQQKYYAGIYWWGGALNYDSKWPGVSVQETLPEDDNIYVAKIPNDVDTIIWNNTVDGGMDNTLPIYSSAWQTANSNTQWYSPGEDGYGFYPEGTENVGSFKNMILVPNVAEVKENAEYTGAHPAVPSVWFYYYGNGEYGKYPTREEAVAAAAADASGTEKGIYKDGEFPAYGFGISDETLSVEMGSTATITPNKRPSAGETGKANMKTSWSQYDPNATQTPTEAPTEAPTDAVKGLREEPATDTVYLDAKATTLSNEDYYAWIWTADQTGSWSKMVKDEATGYFTVQMPKNANVKFARMTSGVVPDNEFKNVLSMTGDQLYDGTNNLCTTSWEVTITAEIDKPEIATLTQDPTTGVITVTPVAVGTATIKVTCKDNDKVETVSCALTVTEKAPEPTQPKTNVTKPAAKKANTLNVKVSKKSKLTVKAKKLKKAKQTVKALTISKAKGKVTVSVVKKGTNKKLLKKVTVNKKGKLTIKKGKYKKGTYKVKIKVKAAGTATYKSKVKTVTAKIRIK